MRNTQFLRVALVVVAVVALLGVVRFQPWKAFRSEEAASRERLTVGFLPVT